MDNIDIINHSLISINTLQTSRHAEIEEKNFIKKGIKIFWIDWTKSIKVNNLLLIEKEIILFRYLML